MGVIVILFITLANASSWKIKTFLGLHAVLGHLYGAEISAGKKTYVALWCGAFG